MHHRSFLFTGKMLPYYKLVRTLAFPSMLRVIALLLSVDLIGSVLAFVFASPTLEAAGRGLVFGFLVLFMPAILADAVSAALLLKDDPLFYLRRCLALSLFSCVMWTLILGLGGIIGSAVRIVDFPQQPFYLALFTVLPLRFLAVFSMSSKKMANKIIFSFLQPLASCFAATLLFNLDATLLATTLSAATALSLVPLVLLLRSVELKGRELIKASPLRIFKAFLVDWLNRKNEMFEKFLEEIGAKSEVELTLIQFNSKKTGEPKGLLVISDFHPGPFLNVGSSPLPHLIQTSLEEDGLIAAVPHGVSGHELNLVSQAQNARVLSAIKSLMQEYDVREGGSPFKRFEAGSAKVGAQVFGKCLLLTLTQSPKDMEDIPFHLGKELENVAKKRFKHVAIVDSHNCIAEARMFTEEEIADLKLAASEAIESSRGSGLMNLEVGASRGILDFGPEQGGGPGGISAFVIRASGQLTAYVTIDANNMALGLREKILHSLEEIGVGGGEIMTTDTHMVNGLVPARLGYYPLGEAVDQDIIVKLVRDAVERAKESLEEVSVLSSSGSVEVKSLGSESLERLMSFLYGVAKLVAKYMLVLFLTSNIIGLALLSWSG